MAGTRCLARSSAPSSEPWGSASRSVANMPVATVLTVMPVAGHLVRERLEQPECRHPVRVRERQPGNRLANRGRGDVDDPAPAALPHPRQHRLRQHPRRQHQRAKGRLPLLERVVERPAVRRPAGVEDQDLDRTERLRHLAGQLAQPVQVPRVRREDLDLSIDLRGRFLAAPPRERLEIATRAPSRASTSAMPRPMPLLAAITRAVRPSIPRSTPLLRAAARATHTRPRTRPPRSPPPASGRPPAPRSRWGFRRGRRPAGPRGR